MAKKKLDCPCVGTGEPIAEGEAHQGHTNFCERAMEFELYLWAGVEEDMSYLLYKDE